MTMSLGQVSRRAESLLIKSVSKAVYQSISKEIYKLAELLTFYVH